MLPMRTRPMLFEVRARLGRCAGATEQMKTILIVEDDKVTAKIYRSILEKAGFKVEVAETGPAALELYAALHPDGLLLDLMLPGVSGIDILKRIREGAAGKKLPIVVYTNAFVPQLVNAA